MVLQAPILKYTTQLQSSKQYITETNGLIDQWSGIETPERNPCLYSQLVKTKGGNIQWGNRHLFQQIA